MWYFNIIMKKQRGYIERVATASKELFTQYGPGFYQPAIMHDDWCNSIKTKKPNDCNCFPDITVDIDGVSYMIDHGGHVHKTSSLN